MESLLKDQSDIKKFSENLLKNIEQTDTAQTVLLSGNLGAGKTTLTQILAQTLGVNEIVNSPTFVIMKIYKLGKNKFSKNWKHLIHIDAYRLENSKELKNLGWEEIISKKENLVVLEWPEKVPEILPKGAVQVNFEFIDENTRKVSVEKI